MGESLPNRQIARGAAAFFVVAGAVGLLRALASQSPAVDRALLFAVALFAMAVGCAAWLAPWDRWSRGAMLSLALTGFFLKSVANLAGGTGPYIYVVHYVALFIWVGVALPAWARGLCAPVFVASYVAPMLILGSSEADLASLGVVAPACIALGELAAWIAKRARNAEQSMRERAGKMATLVDATVALAACHALDELGRLTACGAAQLLEARSSLVLIADGNGGLREVGDLDWKRAGSELPRGVMEHLAGVLRRQGARPDAEADVLVRLAHELGVPALQLIPLQGSSDPLGVALVAFEAPRRALDEFTQYVLQSFGTQAGLGFERMRAAAVLRDESLHDALTGVGNRRKASATLETTKAGDVLVLIDLDHFKHVNDRFGHAAGDRVLRTLAEYLRSCVRPPDEVFRFGGEEFLLVLGGGGQGGLHAVERVHAGWRGQHRVTSFSAGVAVQRATESAEGALARADAALYAAKRAGRNRVVAWSPHLDVDRTDAEGVWEI